MKQILAQTVYAVSTSDRKEVGRYMQIGLRRGTYSPPRKGETAVFTSRAARLLERSRT